MTKKIVATALTSSGPVRLCAVTEADASGTLHVDHVRNAIPAVGVGGELATARADLEGTCQKDSEKARYIRFEKDKTEEETSSEREERTETARFKPCSSKKPSRPLQPGPPWNQKMMGAVEGLV
jgi:hypothetical protein